MSELVSKWSQTVVTVVSLVFGCGVLYMDVQGVKKDLIEAKVSEGKLQGLEVRMAVAEDVQRRTVEVLERVGVSVEKLNVTVAKLETKIDK